jgi:TetR/AcrR family transcriptional regulator, ethionamide resistance regulator
VATATHRTRVRQSREETRERIVAAAELLLQTRSFAELTVDEVMREAGQGRTIFYRHFDDLADLLARASQEAIEALFAAQEKLGANRRAGDPDTIREAMDVAVDIYRRHGPLLRGISEAAAGDERIAESHTAVRRRFDALVEPWLHTSVKDASVPFGDLAETTRALNLMNEHYLLDAFGHGPRVSTDTAASTLTDIWLSVLNR